MITENPEPFGFFRATPCGWEDCAETDEGATPLYDQAAIDKIGEQLMAADYALNDARNQTRELAESAKKAAEEIRRCDYTPARSTLLNAIRAIDAAEFWPRINSPAQVGNGVFPAGTSARFVIEAAQNYYDLSQKKGN